ncbi:MAG: hypothetical protein ACK5HR_05200, partial [Mycoplasmatales bacterium]
MQNLDNIIQLIQDNGQEKYKDDIIKIIKALYNVVFTEEEKYQEIIENIDEYEKEKYELTKIINNLDNIKIISEFSKICDGLQNNKIYQILEKQIVKTNIINYYDNLKTYRQFLEYIEKFDLEEIKSRKKDLYEQEKKMFYQKYTLEKFKNITLEQWAKGESGEYFSNYIERRTHFVGSGHLWTSKNKIFYYTNGVYKVDDKVQDYYVNQGIISIDKQFMIFKKKLLTLINTPSDKLANFNFAELIGKNVMTSKIYNLYSKTPTL